MSPSLGFDKYLLRKANQKSSEIHWSYFHLGPLQAVIGCLPLFLVHTIVPRRGIFMTIDAIQVRQVTPIVPPSAVAETATVFIRFVIIILIASCKWLTTVIRKRVISSS